MSESTHKVGWRRWGACSMVDAHEFLRACRQGGRALDELIQRLYREQGPWLLRDARISLGSVDAARDVLQTAMLRAWSRCAQFGGRSGVATWLRQIVRHAVIDQLRARQPEDPLHGDDGQPLPGVEQALLDAADQPDWNPEGAALQAERWRVYQDCFRRFAAAEPLAATVIRWSAEDDMSIDDIARLLGRSAGATREFLSQCRKKARLHLAPWYALLALADER